MEGIATGSGRINARRGLLQWFLAGFLLVFVGVLVGTRQLSMLPSGAAVVSLPLWQYYLVELHRAFFGSRGIGPASGSTRAMIQTAVWHQLCSIAGGAIMLGIGWMRGKARGRRQDAR